MLFSTTSLSCTSLLPLSTLFPYTTLFRSDSSPPSSFPLPDCAVNPRDGRRQRLDCRLRLRVEFRNRSRRSEEHTSELQSRFDLVCRLVLEKNKIGLWITHDVMPRHTHSL